MWGSEHGKVEALIQMKIEGEGEGTPGVVGTVGESDLSDFEDEGEDEGEEGDDDEAFWGGGVGKDVEMAEAA